MKFFILFIFFVASLCVYAQKNSLVVQDGKQVFELAELHKRILLHHPIAKGINLNPEFAEQEVRMAKGGFDPKLQGDYLSKTYEKKEYYSYTNAGIKIPNWIGEFKAGYEQNQGTFLSDENKTPSSGLLYAGVSIPLGQGLVIDARRATLRQAKLFRNITDADRTKEMNKLLLNATKDYWEWFVAHNELVFIEQGYLLSKERFEAIKERVVAGDLAPIDSTEAKITLQERQNLLRQARIEARNASLVISNYLWLENEIPAELTESTIPQAWSLQSNYLTQVDLERLLAFAEQNHPELQKIRFKIKQLEIEKSYQQDQFKPKINLQYNFLTEGATPQNVFGGGVFQNNYKIGLDFSFPIFLRKERGKVGQMRIKIQQSRNDQQQMFRNIKTELQTTFNDLTFLEQNIRLQEDINRNYELLRNSEQDKFFNGESSVFLINTRETKLIEAQIKLLQLKAKYEKEKATLRWAAGEKLAAF